MSKKLALCWVALLCLALTASYGQSVDSVTDKLVNFPSRFLGKIRSKAAGLDQQLTQQTENYLQRMARREERMKKKLYKKDSAAARQLFGDGDNRYATMAQKMRTDTGSRNLSISGEYQPYTDSLRGTLAFLQKNPQLLSGTGKDLSPAQRAELQGSISELQALQAKMQDADQVKAYVRERKQEIGQYISQHADLRGLFGYETAGMNQDLYYYSQQVRQYKEMLNNPDQLEQKALSLLNQLPAFKNFMKDNSQLGGLFTLPGNYASPASLAGLQTRDQVSQIVQNQVAAGGAGGAAALQSNLQSADAQLDGYKDKLSQLGSGSGDIDMPNFKPNEQKTKTFWKRLEFGTNFQTTHDSYYFPTVTDLGLSLGYRLGNSNVVGVGASYKIGWGNGIQHIALSSEGVGLRSFIEIKIKSSFSAAGGLEYNYTTPFTAYQQLRQLQYWTQSGLIGVSKTVSMKSRVFKTTKLQLLWDFLSYQQVPKTQPVLFRVGYAF